MKTRNSQTCSGTLPTDTVIDVGGRQEPSGFLTRVLSDSTVRAIERFARRLFRETTRESETGASPTGNEAERHMGTIVVAARGAPELPASGRPVRYRAETVEWLWFRCQPRSRHPYQAGLLPGHPKITAIGEPFANGGPLSQPVGAVIKSFLSIPPVGHLRLNHKRITETDAAIYR